MAADPGVNYHLFLTRIPPRLPKEEVEAALAQELRERGVQAELISVVPQSAWKNKGYGFITLAGNPSAEQLTELAAKLDNELPVGGKPVSVRICQPSTSSKPAPAPEQPGCWDQPTEKTTRLCAQVLHMYFARRVHLAAFKAEKLLALLSMTVAPSCSQEAKALALWGRGVFGSLEKMLLAIGESHFGGGWTLTGSIAERSAMLSIGSNRLMQGWDQVRDPLPITTLLRLAACKQRLESGAPGQNGFSGLSTPTACRRSSDCGSLSAMHSTEQPSCSESEAGSWSMCSLLLQGSDASTPCRGSGNFPSSSSTTPASWSSYKSLQSYAGTDHHRHQRVRDPEPPDPGVGTSRSPQNSAHRQSPGPPSCSGRQSARGPGAAGQLIGWSRRPPSAWPQHGTAPASPGPHHLQIPPQHPRALATYTPPPLPRLREGGGGRGRTLGQTQGAQHLSSAAPPSSKDILGRCAKHMDLLFSYHPGQSSFALAYVSEFLSVAQDIVAWGSGSPYFSLEGYAGAVYGSFERFLGEVARLYFGSSWRFEGGSQPGDPRVLCVLSGATHAALVPALASGVGMPVGAAASGSGSATGTPVAVPLSMASAAHGTPVGVPLPMASAAHGTPVGFTLPMASAAHGTPVAVPLPTAVPLRSGGEAAERPSSAHSVLMAHRPRSAHSLAAAGAVL